MSTVAARDLSSLFPSLDSQFEALFGPTTIIPAAIDEIAVANVVSKHALEIGCTDSNLTASVSWGLRNGYDTLSAIRAGKHRAGVLRDRQTQAGAAP